MLSTHPLTFAYNQARQFMFPDMHCMDRQALLILGKSGTGKTILLHLLAALLKPGSGLVQVGETELTGLSPAQMAAFRATHIDIVYQKPHFVSVLSVLDNLLLANYLADRPIMLPKNWTVRIT